MESTSGNITSRFVVHITQHNIFLQPHEIYVVGNIDLLGNWEPRNGLEMKLFSHERLEAQIEIPKNMNSTIEYKYVNITSNDGQANWEHGENRLIHNFESAEFLQIQDIYRDNIPRHAHIPAEIFALDRLFGRPIEKKIQLQVYSNDAVLVRFNVKAGTGHPSHQISVCGNCEQLGEWNLQKACQMNYTDPNWEVDVLVPRDLFPIEYKYIKVYNAASSEFEVGQNRKIALPDISKKTNTVVDLHDVFVNRCVDQYEGMTTPFNEMKAIYEFKGSKELKEFVEKDKSDNGKLIVKDIVALKTAAKYGKPYKLSKNKEEYFVEEEFSATTINYLSLDPDVLFFNDEWADHMSKVIKANSNISILMIESPMPESRDRTLNLNWLFNGLAKNEFPNITSFYFNQYTDDSKIIGSLLKAIKTNKSLRRLSYRHLHLPSLSLSEALEENTSLTELQVSFDSNWRQPFKQTLVVDTIASTKRIKSLTLYEPDSLTTYATLTRTLSKLVLVVDYFTRNQVLQGIEVFFRALKDSTTLVHLEIRGGRCDKDTDKDFQTLLKSIYDENWTLTTMNITLSTNVAEWAKQLTERNKNHHKQLHENIVLTLFNIARSKAALELFPKEVWMQILTELFIPSPFGYDYCSMMIDLFKDNTIRKL